MSDSNRLDPVEQFENLRSDLERLAYRMLGIRADADDVVQDAYLKWINSDHAEVRSPRSYLNSIVTRLCIDRRREIDVRKETYVGPWLPEPIVESETWSAEEQAEVAESVSLALLHVLEALTPTERAAYLLRKMFDYDYAEISEILGKSETNCRQLVSRAESHVHAERPRFDVAREEVQKISDQFLRACSTGDIDGLVSLLADDIVLYSDGGGKAVAAQRPLAGVDHVSRFLLGIFKKALGKVSIQRVLVNGQTGFAAFDGSELITIWTLDIVDHQIRRCFVIRNPDKLVRVHVRHGI